MAVGAIYKIRFDGQLMPSTYGSPFYTVPANRLMTHLELDRCNVDAATGYGEEIQFVPFGQSTSDAYKVISTQTLNALAAGESRGNGWNPNLEAGDMIYVKSGTAGKIAVSGSAILEEV